MTQFSRDVKTGFRFVRNARRNPYSVRNKIDAEHVGRAVTSGEKRGAVVGIISGAAGTTGLAATHDKIKKSAFGVEHEISKMGFKPMGFVKQVGQAYTQGAKMLGGLAGGATQRAGRGMARAGDARGGALGGMQAKTGMGIKRAGDAMQKRPGLTGAGIAGATAVPGTMAANKLKPKQPGRF